MYKLTLSDYSKVCPLFPDVHLTFMMEAMAAGNSPAQIWVDDVDVPRAAFVWDGTHSVYLAGDGDFAAVLASITLPPPITKVYSAHDTAYIARLFPACEIFQRERVLFRLTQPPPADWRTHLPSGFDVRLIDRDLLNQGLPNTDRVLEEIESCWTELDRFFAQGFGFCVVAKEIAAWCTAEYVSGKQCGIGIETVEAYQRRGLATLAASAFLEHCLTQGITAHWDAWASNLPSVATAHKIGLQQVTAYSIHIARPLATTG
ncbi:MAG: GNAT family N-acetyltransferase [Anaerolineae bacterium]